LWAVLRAHALGTSTDTDLNHAGLDRIGDVDACLQSRRALPVQRLGGGCDGEASREGSSAEFGRTAARSEDSADGNVLDEVGIDLRAFEQGFESAVEEVGGLSVLETTLSTLGEGSAESAGYDDLWNELSVESS
jgi:hypothetical protein